MNSLNRKKTTTYIIRNQDPDLGQAHKCGGVKPDNDIATLSSWLVFFWLFIKSPKQSLGDLLFLLRFFLLLFSFSFSFSFLSVNHELVHGRSQELLDRISWNFVEL